MRVRPPLRAELEAKGVRVKQGSWGYRLLVVDDPDGNQLFFNYPAETASGKMLDVKNNRSTRLAGTRDSGSGVPPQFREVFSPLA